MNVEAKAFQIPGTKKLKQRGFAIYEFKWASLNVPKVMPLVDDKPVPIGTTGNLGGKKACFRRQSSMRRNKNIIEKLIHHIFLETQRSSKEVAEKIEKMDRRHF